MDTHTAPRPTGLRKITIPQLRAETAGPVSSTPTSPGRILAAFKRAAPALGVSRRVVDFVDYLMSHNRPQDWEGGPGPIVWPSDPYSPASHQRAGRLAQFNAATTDPTIQA